MTSDAVSAGGEEEKEPGLELGGGIAAALPRVAFALVFVFTIGRTTFAVAERVCFLAAALEARVAEYQQISKASKKPKRGRTRSTSCH